MARLYTNENFHYAVAEKLRELGHDVLTARETGNANQQISDAQVLAFATSNRRAVLTYNRWHFIRLHQQHPTHEGIIVCRRDTDVDQEAERIHNAIMEAEPLNGKLIRVNRPASPGS